MTHIWDYDEKELKKTEKGRILMLERLINYGVYLKDKNRLPISLVRKYWDKLRLEPRRRRFLKFIIWGS